MGIHQREGVISGANMGRPIVTNGTLRCSCAKERDPSELWFGLVCALSQGIAVLNGGPRHARERGGFGRLFPGVYCWENQWRIAASACCVMQLQARRAVGRGVQHGVPRCERSDAPFAPSPECGRLVFMLTASMAENVSH